MIWSVFLVLYAKNTLAEKRVYEITGKDGTNGLYVETEHSQVFQNIGDKKLYLFRQSEELTEWRIGYGESINETQEYFKASGGKDKPPVDGWTNMKGDSERIDWKVIKKPTLVSSLNETETNSGSATFDGGALCLEKMTKDKWIMLEGDDPKICDSNKDCKEGWDEICLGKDFNGTEALTIAGSETKTRGVYKLTRNQKSFPQFYSRVDGWGIISWWRGHDGNGEWLTIGGGKTGGLGAVYRAKGNQTTLPLTNWRDANGSVVSDLLVTVVQHDHSKSKRCTLSVLIDIFC